MRIIHGFLDSNLFVYIFKHCFYTSTDSKTLHKLLLSINYIVSLSHICSQSVLFIHVLKQLVSNLSHVKCVINRFFFITITCFVIPKEWSNNENDSFLLSFVWNVSLYWRMSLDYNTSALGEYTNFVIIVNSFHKIQKKQKLNNK